MIPVHAPEIRGNAWGYVKDCLDSGWVSPLGDYVKLFEIRFASYVGARFAIATQSGTSALHLALAALDIGPGDEVIVPALTFVASANPIAYVGAKPVFVDSDVGTGTLDPALLESVITPRTRAVIPVHLHGHPADMDAIQSLASRYHLAVIEDAAEALGARYRGQVVGALADAGCFSFYGNKLITTGNGGMLVTNDPELAARAAWLANQAQDQRGEYIHAGIGFNYRLSNLQAALGVAQLELAGEFLRRKCDHARLYDDLLAQVPGIIRPITAPWATHSYDTYSIRLTGEYPLPVADLREALWRREIETRPFFVPLQDLPPYRGCRSTPLPVAHTFRRTGLSLPSSVGLTPDQIGLVVGAIGELGAS